MKTQPTHTPTDQELQLSELRLRVPIDTAFCKQVCTAVNAHEEMKAMLSLLIKLDLDDYENLDSLKAAARQLLEKNQ